MLGVTDLVYFMISSCMSAFLPRKPMPLIDVLVIIIPIAVFDMIMTLPTNSVFLLSQMGGASPVRRALLYIMGFFSVAFGAGVLLALPFDWLFDVAANLLHNFLIRRGTFVYGLQLVLGTFLIFGSGSVYHRLRQRTPDEQRAVPDWLGIGGSFALGFGVSLAGIPSALTYFAAIDQILKADPPVIRMVTLLLIYNLIVIAPMLITVTVFIYSDDASKRLLQRISAIAMRLGGWL
jgi:cytochrome c biogenesis protein CcdA